MRALKKNHQYANHRKNILTIGKLQKPNGIDVNKFEGIAREIVNHFGNHFKVKERATKPEMVRISQFFPSFVNVKEFQRLTEEVTKEELQIVMHNFQKDKIPRPNGLLNYIFMGYWRGVF